VFANVHTCVMDYTELLDERIDQIDLDKTEFERMQSMLAKIDELIGR
jgi:hypothetical protein